MHSLAEAAQAISIIAFAWYGMGCFLSEPMVKEFERYRIGSLRVLTGILQVSAAIGLVIGHFYRPLLLLSAAGLAMMMFFAVVTRIRIRDPWYAAIPASSLFALNIFIFIAGL